MTIEERDGADRLLEIAIASYGECNPRVGLEQRVLKRIDSGPSAPKWLLGAACLATLMLILLLPNATRVRRPVIAADIPSATPPHDFPVPAVEFPKRRQKHLRPPKRVDFPSRSPLSEEERALLSVADLPAERIKELLDSAQRGEIAPLRIEKIAIQPLQIDALD